MSSEPARSVEELWHLLPDWIRGRLADPFWWGAMLVGGGGMWIVGHRSGLPGAYQLELVLIGAVALVVALEAADWGKRRRAWLTAGLIVLLAGLGVFFGGQWIWKRGQEIRSVRFQESAQDFIRDGQGRPAAASYDSAAIVARRAGLPLREAEALCRGGDVMLIHGLVPADSAMSKVVRCGALAENSDTLLWARSYRIRGSHLVKVGDFDTAEALLWQSRIVFDRFDRWDLVISVHVELEKMALALGDEDVENQLTNLLGMGRVMSDRLDNDGRHLRAEIRMMLGELYVLQGDTARALAQIDTAFSLLEGGRTNLRAELAVLASDIQRAVGNIGLADTFAAEARRTCVLLDMPICRADALRVVGAVEAERGLIGAADRRWSTALSLTDSSGVVGAKVYSTRADYRRERGDTVGAIRDYQRAVELFEATERLVYARRVRDQIVGLSSM